MRWDTLLASLQRLRLCYLFERTAYITVHLWTWWRWYQMNWSLSHGNITHLLPLSIMHFHLHNGIRMIWLCSRGCLLVQFLLQSEKGPSLHATWALVAMCPVCSALRANSHQLITCTPLKPVHTHLAVLMNWPVLTFSQHLCARVAAWPKCHIWNRWVLEFELKAALQELTMSSSVHSPK